MIEVPKKSNDTQCEPGQASGTPAELFVGVRNEGFGHFLRRALRGG